MAAMGRGGCSQGQDPARWFDSHDPEKEAAASMKEVANLEEAKRSFRPQRTWSLWKLSLAFRLCGKQSRQMWQTRATYCP